MGSLSNARLYIERMPPQTIFMLLPRIYESEPFII